jgi:hypothetical protein
VGEEFQLSKLCDRKSRLIAEFSETIRERGRSREIIVQLSPYNIRVKLKGTRSWYDLNPASCYNLAVSKEVARLRAEKAAARKAKGK